MKYIDEYGVYPNTAELLTEKIQYAIDEAVKCGETLCFKKGTYKTGTLVFKTNLKIFLEKDAVILGSEKIEDYPDNEASFVDAVDEKRGKTLILCYKAKNVEISGEGEICGNGKGFNISTRPFLFRIVESENILLDGIKLTDSAAWGLHINKSSEIKVTNVYINSRVNNNNDGIDIDSSSDVHIENCDISSGDDAICIKTTSDLPTCRVTVKNCKISSGWAGFKVGTETVGDVFDIKVTDCFMYDVCGGGIKLVPTDGSNVSNVYISDIKMNNCTGPVFIVNGERLRKYEGVGRDTFSTIKNVTIKNIEADVVEAKERGIVFDEVWGNAIGGIIISGTKKNMIENLILENITASLPGGIEEYEEKEVSYIGDKYPEFHRMDIVPAKGIYVRDVNTAFLKNIKLSFKKDDVRDCVRYENIINLKSDL